MAEHQQKRKNKKFDSPLPGWLASNPAVTALSHVYGAAVNARNFAYDSLPILSKKADRPVISIGGIRAGGTGKTPVAMLVGQHIIKTHNCGVAFLSRGYGRSTNRQIIVRPNEKADWELTGDEPCMIHNNIPESWLGIGADRSAAAQKLSPLLPEKSVFILDDGFQRRQTRRDLDIVCLGAGAFGDRLIPAGYLREPASSLARAGIVLVIGQEEDIGRLREVREEAERRILLMRNAKCGMRNERQNRGVDGSLEAAKPRTICGILLQYPNLWVEARTGRTSLSPPLARPAVVSGIARPERFLALLRSLSVEPSSVRIFGDHHKFKIKDIASFPHDVYLNGIVTTEKDAVRLLSPQFAFLREIWYIKTGLRFACRESEAAVLSRIDSIVPGWTLRETP